MLKGGAELRGPLKLPLSACILNGNLDSTTVFVFCLHAASQNTAAQVE